MIRKIQIEHYKSIASTKLSLANVSILVGNNSAGKSNFIDAIAFLKDSVVHGLDHSVSERHGIDSIIQWSPTRPYNLEISVEYESELGQGRYSVKLSSKARQPTVLEESGAWRAREKSWVYFSRSKNVVAFHNIPDSVREGFRKAVSTPSDDELLIRNARLFPYAELQPLRYLNRAISDFKVYNIYPNTVRAPQRSSNEVELTSSGDNLHSILKSMVSSKSASVRNRYQEIISTMAKVIPDLDRILVRNLSGLLWPIFEVKEASGRRHQFNVSQISDGALRILGILTALYQPRPPSVIAIEEPEQNIHPGALSLVAEAFKDISSRTQIITTTHSPHMLDYFDAASIYPTEFQNAKTVIGPMSRQQKKAVVERLLTASEVMTAQGFEVDTP
jgi:predicted ATPase